MARVQLRRESTGFQPDSQHDYDELARVNIGDVIAAEVKLSRNPGHHRKAFAMLHRIFDNQDHFDRFEALYDYMKIAAGCVETLIQPDGKIVYKLKSLAWDRMDQLEFERTYQSFITVAYERLGMEWVLEQFA